MREGAIRKVAALLKLGTASRSRDWVQVQCPFARWKHKSGKDSKPSFGIRIGGVGGSIYYCFTCKCSGTLSYLPVDLARTAGRDTSKAMQTMIKIMAIEADEGFGDFEEGRPDDGPPEVLSDKAYGDIFPPLTESKAGLWYIRTRGVSIDAAKFMDLRFDPDEARVVFPVRGKTGKLYGYTGRTILEEKDWPDIPNYAKSRDYFGLPKRKMLLHVDQLRPGQKILLHEGPFDVAVSQTHLMDMPKYHPVGLLGSKASTYQLNLLIDMGHPIYVMLDLDAAGEAGMYGDERHEGLIAKLKPELPVYVPLYPGRKGVDDPGKLTRAELVRALKEAEPA